MDNWWEVPNGEVIARIRNHFCEHNNRWPTRITGGAWEDGDFGLRWDIAWKEMEYLLIKRGLGSLKQAAWLWAAESPELSVTRTRALAAACNALTAWDDCVYMVDLPPDVLRLLSAQGHHAATLLYPAVLAMYEGD